MGEDEVIKKGEEITEGYVNPFLNTDIFAVVAIIIGIIAIIITLILTKKADVFIGGIIVSVFILIVVSIYAISVGYRNALLQEVKDYESWKTEVVVPYIENLPYEKVELDSVKLNTESKNKTGWYKGFDTWTDVSLNVEYKEDGKKVKDTGKFDVIANDKGKPYMKYKDVKKDLGFEIDKGKYEKVIYATKDEIKKWWRSEE